MEYMTLKTKFIDQKIFYDGHQLTPLFAYYNFHILGPSIISWVGGCSVHPDQMVDGEDFLAGEKIAGDEMLHFIVELFDVKLISMVLLQRLFAAQVQQKIFQDYQVQLHRAGDDLYLAEKKLSISIAAPAVQSTLIHFAMNITNAGTPVPTVSLPELGVVDVKKFAESLMLLFVKEYESIVNATCKVKSI